MSSSKERKVRSIVSAHDHAELRQHYEFVPDSSPSKKPSSSTWQQRMVAAYDRHLYRDYVLADLTRVSDRQLGLRWRTQAEVVAGRGSTTCGNKHCPSSARPPTAEDQEAAQMYRQIPSETEAEEESAVKKLAFGVEAVDFEVPFDYVEQGEHKRELVKLRLCARCAPKLFVSRGDTEPFLAARRAREGKQQEARDKKRKRSERKRERKRHKRRDDNSDG